MLSSVIQERLEINLQNGIEIDENYFWPTRVRGKRDVEEQEVKS